MMQFIVAEIGSNARELYCGTYTSGTVSGFMLRGFQVERQSEWSESGEWHFVPTDWLRRYRIDTQERVCNLCCKYIHFGGEPCRCGVSIANRFWLPGDTELNDLRSDVAKRLPTLDSDLAMQIPPRCKARGSIDPGTLNLNECFLLLGYVADADETSDRLEKSHVLSSRLAALGRSRDSSIFERD